MKLKFFVDGQKLSRRDENFVVSDSRNYLSAKFFFSQEWNSMAKSAIFKNDDGVYTVILEDGMCKVPSEVMGAEFRVSVFGTDGDVRITTDSLVVQLEESGYADGETPSEPTPSVYEVLLAKATAAEDIANAAKSMADGKADAAALSQKAEKTEVDAHTQNTQNPHVVTKEQIGLGNVDNTSDMDKPVSDAVALELSKKASVDELESIRGEARSAWQAATTTAGGLDQNTRELRDYIQTTDERITYFNQVISELDAKYDSITNNVDEEFDRFEEELGDISAALNSIISLQNSYIGGDSV